MREFFFLRKDGPMVFAKHCDAHFDGIGVSSIRFRVHAQILRTVKAESIVEPSQPAGIPGREGHDVQIAAFQEEPRADTFLQRSPPKNVLPIGRQIG